MYIVCYDVSSDHLRTKISKQLENYGRRIQYSVFECELSGKRYRELLEKLTLLMEGVENGNIYIYCICERCMEKKEMIGIPGKAIDFFTEKVIVI